MYKTCSWQEGGAIFKKCKESKFHVILSGIEHIYFLVTITKLMPVPVYEKTTHGYVKYCPSVLQPYSRVGNGSGRWEVGYRSPGGGRRGQLSSAQSFVLLPGWWGSPPLTSPRDTGASREARDGGGLCWAVTLCHHKSPLLLDHSSSQLERVGCTQQ